MKQLRHHLVGPGICQLVTKANLHVGNLKFICGVWKFKAIGYDEAGNVAPGGGPLTDRHNIVFADLNDAEINRVFQSDASVWDKPAGI